MTNRFGFWAAMAAVVTSVAYGVPQLLQVAGVLPDPWDRIFIFAPSLALAPSFVLTMAAVHVAASAPWKAFSLGALGVSVMYATLVSIVYVTQLSVVIPHDIRGEGAAVAFLACCGQGQFLTGVDLLGYTLMSIATLLAAPVFSGRAVRWWMAGNGILAPFLIAQLAWPSLIYAGALWLISFPVAMALVAIRFTREPAATVEVRGRNFDARLTLDSTG
ncbi:MAG TPA: hypothetical protein VHA70_02625 [Bauldia sp.]|nr:hypothetical protein [Bauldia sp.]